VDDLAKFEVSGDQTFVEKPDRRGKTGWDDVIVSAWKRIIVPYGCCSRKACPEQSLEESTMFDLIYFLLIGLAAGWLAGTPIKVHSFGLLCDRP